MEEDLIIALMEDSHLITAISQTVRRPEDYNKEKLPDRAMFSAIETGMFFNGIKEIINGNKDNRTSNGLLFREMIIQ